MTLKTHHHGAIIGDWKHGKLEQIFYHCGSSRLPQNRKDVMFGLIRKGAVQTVKLSPRMVRITLDQLLNLAVVNGYEVVIPDAVSKAINQSRQEDHKAKCRMTPKAGAVLARRHHYTMGEVLSKFNLKYGRLYETATATAWNPSMPGERPVSRRKAVEEAITAYNEEQKRTSGMTGILVPTS